MENLPNPAEQKHEAIKYITAKLSQIFPTGRVDSEPDKVRAILIQLEHDKISPTFAKKLVDDLIEARSDYN